MVALSLSFAPGAGAAEKISLEVGGAHTQYFGYVANDDDVSGEDFTGFDQKSDGEIAFAGETMLDNGIQFGAEVILKSESTPDEQIDGSHMWNEGAYGRVELGTRDNAAALMHYAAPDVGLGINDSDIADWVTNPTGGDADSAFQSTFLFLGEGKANKITYFSPRFQGFQLGFSYIPEFEANANTQPSSDIYRDAIAIGANYVMAFGDGNELALSAGFLTADSPDGVSGGKSAEGYSFGGNLTVGAWTVGGSYAATDGNPEGGTDTSVSFDGSGLDIGVAYAFDPATVSLSYYHGEIEDQVAVEGDSSHDTVMLSLSYDLGPGITALASLFHTRFEQDTGTDNEGTTILGGISLEF